jgi:hypothetical protein
MAVVAMHKQAAEMTVAASKVCFLFTLKFPNPKLA